LGELERDVRWPWLSGGRWDSATSDRGLATNGGLNLFKARLDGSELTQLTFDESGFSIRQSWSPDGEWIAFVKTVEYNGPGDLWVMRADGSDARILFEGAYANGFDHVSWSPDGAALVVPADGGGVVVVPVDGTDPQMIAGTEEMDAWYPRWSPTGNGWPIVFGGADRASGQIGLWYAEQDGAATHFVAFDMGLSWQPIWAPDGNQVVFGFEDQSGDLPETDIYFFQAVSSFWP
jgi:Tol biopolymer transport system component